MDKLKPCPFCGGEVKLSFHPYYGTYRVRCYGCGCYVNQHCAIEDEATEAWNRRTEDEELRFTREFIVDHGLLYELLNAFEERKKVDNAGNEMR